MKELNILLVGVGGQGTILASKIISYVALAQGLDVKMSEIHGMAQRGGSVVTQVRMATKVYSPIIEQGQADIIVAFEQLEGYRWAHFLKPGGVLIVNNQQIAPLPVLIGALQYPATILGDLQAQIGDTTVVPAIDLATQAGNIKSANVVMVGALAKRLDFPLDIWQKALEERVPSKLLEVNKKAFEAGLAFSQSA